MSATFHGRLSCSSNHFLFLVETIDKHFHLWKCWDLSAERSTSRTKWYNDIYSTCIWKWNTNYAHKNFTVETICLEGMFYLTECPTLVIRYFPTIVQTNWDKVFNSLGFKFYFQDERKSFFFFAVTGAIGSITEISRYGVKQMN